MRETASFEQALKELETIVEQLQRSEVPLEEAVALYQRATELAQTTEEMLAGAELQVQQLTEAVREHLIEYSAEDVDEEN